MATYIPRDYITSTEHRLCYVAENRAYFAPCDPMSVNGDDWDTSPYHLNAGEPSSIPCAGGGRYYGVEADIVVLAYDANVDTPRDLYNPNSPFTVEDINSGEVPWLMDPSWSITRRSEANDDSALALYPGATMEEFMDFITAVGGVAYVRLQAV